MKKLISLLTSIALIFTMASCGTKENDGASSNGGKAYKVGICNYVDDASLNQIVASIKTQLETLGKQYGCTFDITEQNANADANVMEQIISNFIVDNVDLMVGVATPVAMAMQSKTDSIPIVFAAVSDPISTKLVDSLEKPGANVTGTSDALDTAAIMKLIFATGDSKPTKIGLLYDKGQDSSTTAIQDAKRFLDQEGVEYIEATGTNSNEVLQAAEKLVAEKVDAVFTPTDNTIMEAEYSIYDKFIEAKIPHYTGADSFALNGAFLGYGVDYANLGKETANMICDILVNKKDPATTSVKTFDNGTATINTETAEAIGYKMDDIKTRFEPLCTKIEEITTAESFDDVK